MFGVSIRSIKKLMTATGTAAIVCWTFGNYPIHSPLIVIMFRNKRTRHTAATRIKSKPLFLGHSTWQSRLY
jgi:hypothetical protein